MFRILSRFSRTLASLTLASVSLTGCLPPSALHTFLQGDHSFRIRECETPTVHALAKDIDLLEAHIEKYGSVVAKQPDVWGQARLTKHREDFEKQMIDRLGKFEPTLQGSLSRTDQAYYANATALGAAISGRQAGLFRPSPRVMVNNATAAGTTLEQPAGVITTPPTATPATGAFDAFAATAVARNQAALAGQIGFKNFTSLSLEPTEDLDQRARYLNHLNELRRINEGDDTADSPGYALNLVRIPVSVLPGKKTDVGHAAEVTMNLQPVLGEELLPTTFRSLVMNDLLDQIGVPLTEALNDIEVQDTFRQELTQFLVRRPGLYSQFLRLPPVGNPNYPASEAALIQAMMADPGWSDLLLPKDQTKRTEAFSKAAGRVAPASSRAVGPTGTVVTGSGAGRIPAALGKLRGLTVPATKLRRARLPFAPSQVVDIYSPEWKSLFVLEMFEAFVKDRGSRPCPCNENRMVIHLPDLQGVLQEELSAAYRLLSEPANQDLWGACSPQLVAAIRTQRNPDIDSARGAFLTAVAAKGTTDAVKSSTVALAWAIVVESALLTDQLVRDMKEVASNKGCGCGNVAWLPYYLPCPPPDARHAFNDYVRCRWPIHVFALDPVNQEQNIADSFSRRREMQLALSLAFVSGQINANTMTRFARRLEADFQTIDLNRTQVGFSHGNDTFGWRFYPRFQTPPTPGNATVFFRDLLIGGPSREADLAARKLEPGMRECVAVVIMPSFVPYATLDVSTKWFKLNNPKAKEPDLTDAMKLSKSSHSIQVCSQGVCDADCYRPGDVERLKNKARQLEARLPMQSTTVQIPYENTLGGFAMFNSGVTDLAPQLTGYYGAPGIDPQNSTTLFLMGNHFSVHQTRVIAGGKEIPLSSQELLSRQVVKVTVPAGAQTVFRAGEQFVDVHLATPYGVTAHLLIPVCAKAACGGGAATSASGLSWATKKLDVGFIYSGVGIVASQVPVQRPEGLKLAYAATGAVKAGAVTLTINGLDVPFDGVPYNEAAAGFSLPSDKVTDELFKRYGRAFGPEQTNPPQPVEVSARVQPLDADLKPIGAPLASSDKLAVSWIKAPK